eukprot:TRINITY_DN1122_c0_g1_i3.p2 TRINITY_DN1122_c0_g1~~TRINITY_DN1122_c0_g1_i3.p2  ORF type:complete len:103 (-),score=12.96 TRINITY_DN1122_c0_g1_i3:19-327(-)
MYDIRTYRHLYDIPLVGAMGLRVFGLKLTPDTAYICTDECVYLVRPQPKGTPAIKQKQAQHQFAIPLLPENWTPHVVPQLRAASRPAATGAGREGGDRCLVQ